MARTMLGGVNTSTADPITIPSGSTLAPGVDPSNFSKLQFTPDNVNARVTAPIQASRGPALLKPQPSPTAVPPPVANPNAAAAPEETNPTGGFISTTGGAGATISPTGVINRNEAWNTMQRQNLMDTGHGGTLNVLPADVVASHFPGEVTSGGAGGGAPGGYSPVWEGNQAQTFRDTLNNYLSSAMKEAQEGGVYKFGGRMYRDTMRSNGFLGLAGNLANVISGGFNQQGLEREAGFRNAIQAQLAPSEIGLRSAEAGYYSNRGESMMQNAMAHEQIANQQLEIANMKAGQGKYGDTNLAAENLKAKGIEPSPENIKNYLGGHDKYVAPVKGKTGFLGGLLGNNTPAIPGHYVPSNWTPAKNPQTGRPLIDPGTGLPQYNSPVADEFGPPGLRIPDVK